MTNPREYTTCTYHSPRWAELVEQGWITMYVIEGIAHMLKERP